MKTVGKFLKEARLKKKYSLAFLEEKTKIKKEFIGAIETEGWKSLPEFPVVSGFVKSLASYLKLETEFIGALLKRDYPPKALAISPKPDVTETMFWTPKHTFFVGIAVILVLVVGYLGFQYYKFLSPPGLEILEPKDGAVIKTREVIVSGKTDPDAVLVINNQPVLLEEDGKFTAKIEIFEKTQEIVVSAKARSGKETTITRKIIPELK